MNTNTGELMRILDGHKITEGFNELIGEEAKEADEILGEKQSVMLPENHPLRVRVTERVRAEESRALHAINFKAKRKQSRDSRRRNRK
jgi:NCAIR mutase (PurE)-related protein